MKAFFLCDEVKTVFHTRNMNNKVVLNKKWIRASILGTVWASSEIVLGAFLHNLHIPFSGNILTAIGIVILISSSYKWREQGLFWRAGLITAMMKTLSPSAFIFGPMFGILTQGLLMELCVFLFGYNLVGFSVGAILAMSSNLIQKILNLVIFYSYNLVDIYTNMMQYAERQLHLKFDVVWLPIIVLLIIYGFFGFLASLIGMRTGKRIRDSRIEITVAQKEEKKYHFFQKKRVSNFPYAIYWLVLDVLFIIFSLSLSGRINFWFWIAINILIIVILLLRYRRTIYQLVRPRIWVLFVLITLFSVLVFSRLQEPPIPYLEAVKIGVEMNIRAIILILGFSALGTEFYNPRVRSSLQKGRSRNLTLAIQLSVEMLPGMLSVLPDIHLMLRKPIYAIRLMMQYADERMEELTRKVIHPRIIIITGSRNSGKTTFIQQIISYFQVKSKKIGGFYSQKVIDDKNLIGYDIFDIQENKSYPFLRLKEKHSQNTIGRFEIIEEGLIVGRDILAKSENMYCLCIDEIGELELKMKGWRYSLDGIIKSNTKYLIFSVNKRSLSQVLEQLHLEPQFIIDLDEKPTFNDFLRKIKDIEL